MDKKEMLKAAIEDVKKSIARIEAKQDLLSDEKMLKAITGFDAFDVILRKFWIF